MATAVELCNVALGRVGHRGFIASLTEETEGGECCAVAYPHALKTILGSFRWKFATRHALLAPVVDGEVSGWAYGYTLPSDYVAHGYLYNAANVGTLETADGRTPFAIEDVAGGARLYTDEVDAELVYISDATPVSRFPPLFCEALVWLLASELAFSLAAKPALGAQLRKYYDDQALPQAKAASASEEQRAPQAESEFIRARS